MNLYLARDMDGMLHAFPHEPYFDRGFGAWMPDCKHEMADTYRVMPRDWFPEIEPGKCVLLEEAKPAVVLDGELLRVLGEYLPILERAELDPETWARLTEGTGIATLNRYRHIIAKAGNGGRA